MRTTLLVTVALLALLTAATPATAEHVGVGDCQKFSGACAGACIDLTTGCQDGHLICFGVSYQVPQCFGRT